MLIQLDGSHHAWLEDRGPKFALLLAVDDATSTVVNAVFCTSETTAGYFMLLEGLIAGWGIPLALYSDRHAVFKHNARKPETAAEATQFTRSLQELGVRQIFARSPQAKGRVERAAGTFQDRLVTELRLADARTMDQATAVLQDFLPRYNARFAVQPEHPEPAYRPADPDLCLPEILCFKDTRKVARDNTVKYNWRVLQLLPDQERTSYAGLRAEVLERPDGELIVLYEGRRVATQEPPPRMGALCGCHRLVPWTRTQTYRQQRGGSSHQQVPAAPSGRPGAGASGRACPQICRRQGRRRDGHRQQGIEPVDAYAHANPTGPVESDPAGPSQGTVPESHCEGTRDRTRHRAQVRLRRKAAYQETQRPGTGKARGATQNRNCHKLT